MHFQAWYFYILNFFGCHQQETKNSPPSSNQKPLFKNSIYSKFIHFSIKIGHEQKQAVPSEEQIIKIKNKKREREQNSKSNRQHQRCRKSDFEDVSG
jgi:hypothetical protein